MIQGEKVESISPPNIRLEDDDQLHGLDISEIELCNGINDREILGSIYDVTALSVSWAKFSVGSILVVLQILSVRKA